MRTLLVTLSAASMLQRATCAAMALVALLLMPNSFAQSVPNDPRMHLEYADQDAIAIETELRALGLDLMGDNVELDRGALSFRHVDVSIPGNSALPVQIARRLSHSGTDFSANILGGWLLEVPLITMRFTDRITVDDSFPTDRLGNHDVCTNRVVARAVADDENDIQRIWYGIKMLIPDVGLQEIIDIDTGNAPAADATQVLPGAVKTTTDSWNISCLSSIQNGSGEGFVATAPDGTKYFFDYLQQHRAGWENIADYRLACGNTYEGCDRNTYHVVLYGTRVEDAYGNWVEYRYTDGYLTEIAANDGRSITLQYNSVGTFMEKGALAAVTANGRTWQYSYYPHNPANDGDGQDLKRVTLPDGRYWEFTQNLGENFQGRRPPRGRDCVWELDNPGYQSATSNTYVMRHPSGAQATYDTRIIKHGRKDAPKQVVTVGDLRTDCDDYKVQDWGFSEGVTTKTLTLPDGPTSVWQYLYEEDNGGTSVADEKYRDVVMPDGTRERVFINRVYDNWLEGQTTRREVRDNSNVTVSTEIITHIKSPALGDKSLDYVGPLRTNHNVQIREQLVERTVDGETYSTQSTYNFDLQSPDYSYGYPVLIETYSTVAGGYADRRIFAIDFTHNLNHWLIGLPATVTRNGKLFDEFLYEDVSLPGKLTTYKSYGITRTTYTYYASGLVQSLTDAVSRITTFHDYHRGVPQRIVRADAVELTRVVDDNGWVTSMTDGEQVTTGYQYNDIGWLTTIDRPSSWEDTTFSYSNLGASNFQLLEATGNRRAYTYYDGLYRPWKMRIEDAADIASTRFYTHTEYDEMGRTLFEMAPNTSVNGSNFGVETTYDALGRVVETRENVAPYATTTYAYLSGNRTSVTDPEGNVTITTRTGYGSPDDGDVIKIEQPEGVTTDMTYDVWGNMLTARQHGSHNGLSADVMQHYAYDSRLRLCRHHTPETGAKLFAYNDADELTSYVEGRTGTSGCGSVTGAGVVSLTYDALGRLDVTDFSDATPDIDRAYDGNGNLSQVTRGGTVWTYTYDYAGTEDYLTGEALAIDGLTFSASYAYDSLGNRVNQTFPSGRVIDFAPDALGRATKAAEGATNYASAITYHPNNQVAGLSYDNDNTYSLTQDYRQLPLNRRVFDGSTGLVDYTYSYDRRAKITRIADGVTSANSVDYVYDGVGRLTSTLGPWGASTYTYDPVGNIRSAEREGGTTPGFLRAMAYDARGNVTHDGNHSFTYDLANQPITMGGAATASFVYDGNLKRVRQTIGGETIYSVYGQDGTLLHRKEAGSSTDYIRAAGMAVARVKDTGGSAEVSFMHADHLGSPVAATDGAGALLWRDNRTPFGEPWGPQDPANDNNTGFTGHIEDTATGLTYMQARYYDPVLGRFLSFDPVQFSVSNPELFGRYTYGYNDPVNVVDPDGELGIAGALVGGGIELAFQLASAEGRQAYAAAGQALASGDFGGAVSAAGAQVGRVAIASAAGAVGQVGASRVASIASSVSSVQRTAGTAQRSYAAIQVGGNAAVGAATGGATQAARNALTGDSGSVAGAALGGALGGAIPSVASIGARGSTQLAADASGIFIGNAKGQVAAPNASQGIAEAIAEVGGAIAGGAADQQMQCSLSDTC